MRLRGFLLFFFSLGWLVLQGLQAHERRLEFARMRKISPAFADMMLESQPQLFESLVTLASIPGVGIGLVIFLFDLKEWWRKREDAGFDQAD